jgi:S1-C subfamily serine protease
MATDLVNLSNEMAAAVERASASLVAVHGRRGIGSSGIIWRDNLIVTSSEGIRIEEGIKLTLPDGRAATARLRGRDPGTDLAVLETDAGGLHPLASSGGVPLKVGQLALAVGRTSNTGSIASFGIISGISGEWKTWRGGTIDTFVRLDISVYPTLSGGAALDPGGNLIGLISTGLSRSSVFAVTGATIDRIAAKLIEHGYISHGFLGVALQPVALPQEIQEKLHQDAGIMLLGIEPGGPAAASGLILGDVLVTAGGQPLARPEALAELLQRTVAGQTVTFRVLRAQSRPHDDPHRRRDRRLAPPSRLPGTPGAPNSFERRNHRRRRLPSRPLRRSRRIVVYTSSGASARLISRLRPPVPIYAFTQSESIARQLTVSFGVTPIIAPDVKSTDQMLFQMEQILVAAGLLKPNDNVVFVAGQPIGRPGSTNLVKLHRLGESN